MCSVWWPWTTNELTLSCFPNNHAMHEFICKLEQYIVFELGAFEPLEEVEGKFTYNGIFLIFGRNVLKILVCAACFNVSF